MICSFIKSIGELRLQLSQMTHYSVLENPKYEIIRKRQLISLLNSSSKKLYFFPFFFSYFFSSVVIFLFIVLLWISRFLFFIPMLPFVKTFSPHSAFRESSILQVLRPLVLYLGHAFLKCSSCPSFLTSFRCFVLCKSAIAFHVFCFFSVSAVCVFFSSPDYV